MNKPFVLLIEFEDELNASGGRVLERRCEQNIQRLIKSTCGVYCNTMFHVAKAKIIRHINMVFHVGTLAHFSVPKRKSVGKKWSIG